MVAGLGPKVVTTVEAPALVSVMVFVPGLGWVYVNVSDSGPAATLVTVTCGQVVVKVPVGLLALIVPVPFGVPSQSLNTVKEYVAPAASPPKVKGLVVSWVVTGLPAVGEVCVYVIKYVPVAPVALGV